MPRKTKEQKEMELKQTSIEKEEKLVAPKTKKATAKTTKKTNSKAKKINKTSSEKKEKTNVKRQNKKNTTKKTKQTTTKLSSQTKQPVDVIEYYDLPYRYNQTIVKVLAQTPNHLFIYWDISDEDRKNYQNQYGENFFEVSKPVLIVHNDTLGYSFEIEINDFANSWYLQVNDSKCHYRIELGRRPIIKNEQLTSDYIYVSTSNHIESPNDHILYSQLKDVVYYKNIKTNQQTAKPIPSVLSHHCSTEKINSLSDLYQKIYQKENAEETFNGAHLFLKENPSSGTFSSQFK